MENIVSQIEKLPKGTFKQKMFKYPEQIDILSNLNLCCTYNAARISAAESIQTIIKSIVDDETGNIFFKEFVTGCDKRYNIYIGYYGENGLVDYSPSLIRRDINNIYNVGLLSDWEHKYIMSQVLEDPTPREFSTLSHSLRKHWLLKWDQDEILTGYKILRGGLKLFLDEALSHSPFTKLDLIALMDYGSGKKYVEISNYMKIDIADQYGNALNYNSQTEDYLQSLVGDIIYLRDFDTMKSVKRLWTYCHMQDCGVVPKVLTNIFYSDINKYSILLSDLKIALFLVENNIPYNKKILVNSINQQILQVQHNCFVGVIDFADTNILDKLTILITCLQKKVNRMTQNWLDENQIVISDIIGY